MKREKRDILRFALAKPAILFPISVGTCATNSTSYATRCERRKRQSWGVEGDSTSLYGRQIEIVAHPVRIEKAKSIAINWN